MGTKADTIRAEAESGIHLVPHHLKEGLMRHVVEGGRVGQFLDACLCNDLLGAVNRGDPESLAGLKGIVQFLYNFAPSDCWGSPAKVAAWRTRGGAGGGG